MDDSMLDRHGATIEGEGGTAHGTFSRRKFLAATALLSASGALGFPKRAHAAQSIAVTCWGGSYEKGIREHFADPFTKETGIEVILVNNGDLTKMKVQVESKNVQW